MAQVNTLAGKVVQVSGPVSVVRDGQTITLQQGDSVFTADTIETHGASIELSFVDGAKALLGPQSVMSVQELSEAVGSTSFVLNLAAGAMRSISGKIVEQNPDSFKVLTPKSTVGIRGTDFITKVNENGSEVHAVISLSQGHNLVVTTHDGKQISLTAQGEGVFIGQGSSNAMSPYSFTDEELEEIVSSILGLLEFDETNKEDDALVEVDNSFESLSLAQSLVTVLGEEGSVQLLDALVDSGLVDSADADDALLGLGGSEDVDLGLLDVDDPSEPFAPSEPSGSADSFTPETPFDDGYVRVSTDGSMPFYADTELDVSAGDVRFSNHRVDVTGNISDHLVIVSGDLNTLSGGTATGGNDIITGQDANNGRIVGDANIVDGGTLVSGNDTITLNSKTGGSSIYGDVGEINGTATVSLGHDSIHVRVDLSNTAISGDANIIADTATITQWGNDTLSVGGNVTDANIYGDYNAAGSPGLTEGGDDIISVGGTVSGNSGIYGNGGDDNISISSYTSGIIDGGEGIDTLTINTLTGTFSSADIQNIEHFTLEGVGSGGVYNGDAANNDITFMRLSGTGQINGLGGDDNITISQSMSGGVIDGGAGTDTASFSTSNVTGTVTGVEHVHLANGMSSGTLTATTATTFSKDGSDGLSMNGGTLAGSDAADTFTVENQSSGLLQGNGGNDTFTLQSMSGGTIDGGADSDTVTFTTSSITGQVQNIESVNFGQMTAGNLSVSGTSTVSQDGINGITMNGGTLSGGAGAQDFIIQAMNGGTVLGGADGDSINIANLNSGTVDGGLGQDTLIIDGFSTGATLSNTGVVQDLVYLTQGLLQDITLNLNSAGGGFVVSQDTAGIAFSMTNSTLTGSGADDEFLVDTVNNSQLYGGAGEDVITIDTMQSGIVNGGADADEIYVTTANGGTLGGGAGVDTINIFDAVNAAVTVSNEGTGKDALYLAGGINAAGVVTLTSTGDGFTVSTDGVNGLTMTTGTINGSAAADTFMLATMNGGTIDGGGAADVFTANTLTGGTLSGDGGNDSFETATYVGTTINGGEGQDTLTITATVSNAVDLSDVYLVESIVFDSVTNGASITGSAGNDSITIESMDGGSIGGNGGTDTVIVNDLQGTTSYFENLDELWITTTGTPTYTTNNVNKIYVNGVERGAVTTRATLGVNETLMGTALADVLTVGTWTGGTIESLASNDNIIIENEINTGDALTATNSGGSDTIFLQNTFTLGTLDMTGAGAFTVTGTDLATGFTMTGGTMNGTAGGDTFNVGSHTGGTINGGDGNDTFTVTSQDGGIINGGNGNDVFYVESLLTGTIDGGDGSDSIITSGPVDTSINLDVVSNVESISIDEISSGGSISLRNGGDVFSVNTLSGTGEVLGGTGADQITVTNFTGGTVDGGAGADSIYIQSAVTNSVSIGNAADGDNIYLRDGIATGGTITLSGTGNYTVQGSDANTGFSMNGGTLSSSAGADVFRMASLSTGSRVEGGGGDDAYYMTTAQMGTGGTIADSQGASSVFLTTAIDGGTLNLEGSTGFTVRGADASTDFNMSGGTLNGSAGADTFHINQISTGAVVSGGAGADSFAIQTASYGATVNTGDGADAVTVTNVAAGGMTISNSGADADTVEIDGIDSGANVTLNAASTGGFTVSGNIGQGNIIGSAAVDTFDVQSSGGRIDSGAGADTITFTGNLNNGAGVTNNGAEEDTVYIRPSSNIDMEFSGTGDFVITNADGGMGLVFDATGNHRLSTGSGADSIVIDTAIGATVTAGAGNDTITANSYTGDYDNEKIDGEAGNDSISVGTLDGSIHGGAGADNIKVTTWSGGYINTGADAEVDVVTITNMNGLDYTSGVINTGTVADRLNIESEITDVSGDLFLSNSSGTAGFTVTNSTGTGFSISGGSLWGSGFADTMTVNTAAGGTIYSGGGADTISIANAVDFSGSMSIYNSDSSQAWLNLQGGLANGTVTLNSNGDIGFNVYGDHSTLSSFQMSGGILNGTHAGDLFSIGTMSGGALNADDNYYDGNDTITITTMSGGSVNGDGGDDSIHITSFNGGTISGGGGTDTVRVDEVESGTLELHSSVESYVLTEVTGGTVRASTTDTINVETLNGGTLESTYALGNDGANVFINNTLDAGAGRATILNGTDYRDVNVFLKNGMDSGTLNLTTQGNGQGFNVYGTEAYGGFAMSGGTINGSDGSDMIYLSDFTGGTVNTKEGSYNYVHVKNAVTAGNLTIINESDYTAHYHNVGVRLEGGMSGGTLNLTASGTAGFDVDSGSYANNQAIGFDFSGGTINGSTAADIFTIKQLSNGNSTTLNADDGDDKIIVQDYVGGRLNGGFGTDSLVVENISGALDLGSLVSIENVTINGLEGKLLGKASDDDIAIERMESAELDGGGGNDEYTIHSLSGTGNVFTNAGTVDILYMAPGTTYTATNTTVLFNGQAIGNTERQDTLSSGYFLGTSNADNLTVGTWTGGIISSNGSSDHIHVENALTTGTQRVENTSGKDSIFLNGGISGGNLTLHYTGVVTVEGFYVGGAGANAGFTMSSGSITGGVGADTVNISSMSGGTVNGNGGNDSITVTDMQDGTLQGGLGEDVFKVTNWTEGQVDGGDAADMLNISTVSGQLDLDSDILNVENVNIDTVLAGGEVSTSRDVLLNNVVGGKVSAGDRVAITGSMDGGTIEGDGTTSVSVGELQGLDNNFIGVNDLSFTSVDSGAMFTVDDTLTSFMIDNTTTISIDADAAAANSNTSAGSDTVYVREVEDAGTVNLNGGDDRLFVVGLKGAVTGDAGNDTISVGTMEDDAARLDGGVGNDVINVNIFKAGTIDGGSDSNNDDTITIGTMEGGTVAHSGYSDSDSISVNLMKGGTIEDGYKEITIETFENGIVNGSVFGKVEIGHMSGGTLNGTAECVITVSSLKEGRIVAGNGKGDITVGISNTENEAGDRPVISLGKDSAEDILKLSIEGGTGNYYMTLTDYDGTDKIKFADEAQVTVESLTASGNSYTFTDNGSTLTVYFA